MKSLALKYPQHRQGLGYDAILDIQHNHSYCAHNYDAQISYLQQLDEKERLEAKKAEQQRHLQFLGDLRVQELAGEIGLNERVQNSNGANKRQKIEKNAEAGAKSYCYSSRSARQNALEDDSIDKEDHVLQRPWQPELQPTPEELQRRHEMRKEQGCKLKEMMQKKREEKNQKLQDELDSLNQILFGK